MVINPSFEEYGTMQTTPYYLVDTFFARNWTNIYASYPSTPDLFVEGNVKKINEEKILKMFDVPKNYLGFHPAHTGKAYAGLILLNMNEYMEHLTCTLTSPLEKSKT